MITAVDTYSEANAYCRAINESFFKLAAMSFFLNSTLLVANSFVISKDVMDQFEELRIIFGIFTGIAGVIYNFGAMFAYNSYILSYQRLAQQLISVEKNIDHGIEIQSKFFIARGAFMKLQKIANLSRIIADAPIANSMRIVFHLIGLLLGVFILTNIFYIIWIVCWGVALLYYICPNEIGSYITNIL